MGAQAKASAVGGALRNAINERTNRGAMTGMSYEKGKETRAAFRTIAEGYIARQQGEPRDANPHAWEANGFWPRQWLRGWELANAGRPVRFSVVREKRG